jgi:hypothetical protein
MNAVNGSSISGLEKHAITQDEALKSYYQNK